MITSFQKIKKIGCYDDYVFDASQLATFQKVNVFYGANGTGKTTLSNILYLLSKYCKEKKAVFDEIFDDVSELELKYDTQKITQKNILSHDIDLYVFNSKFVIDHVYNGNVANIDSFSSEVKLTNDVITGIDNRLNVLALRWKKVENWGKLLQDKLDSIWNTYDKEFQKKVSNARLTNVKPSIVANTAGNLASEKAALDKLYQEYKNKSGQAATIEKLNGQIEAIKALKAINIDLIEGAKKLGIPLSVAARKRMSDRVKKISDAIELKKLGPAIGDLSTWLRTGGRLLHISKDVDKHCPLCDTDLSANIDALLNDFSNYFSTAIVELFDFIDASCLHIDQLIADNFASINSSLVEAIRIVCTDYDINLPVFDGSKDNILEKSLTAIRDILKEKKLSPEIKYELKEEDTSLISGYTQGLLTFKNSAIKLIQDQIDLLMRRDLDKIVKDIKAQLTKITTIEFNQDVNKIFNTKKSNAVIASLNEKLKLIIEKNQGEIKRKRNDEVAKLNAESKYINLYLNYLGITNFYIDRDKNATQDNLLITYTKSGKRKNKLQHSLSEGEKTALAFAYFISKLRVERVEGNTDGLKNCIIVIDDPVSSLDDNRLFQTANLIDSFLFYTGVSDENHPKQLFVFSHNLTFLKYFHNAVKANSANKDKIEEYYLSNSSPQIGKIPSGLKNFTNTYIIKLKEIQKFKENLLTYETAKNYLPNYIRVVLETFLAFKLAMVNDKHDMLPGMSSLINALITELNPIADETIEGINKDGIIKRLNHLKKIADHESHGSIYKAEEFSFISEAELKEFAKHTLQVINYIDALHFRRVNRHT
jgi:wobble nucleotide-excising tRNase